MKWLQFVILAVIAVVCQTTVVEAMAIHGIRPNWVFILAVHYALWAPWPEAAIAGWLLGLTLDMTSMGRVGVHAFTFGAAVWLITYIRQAVFRDHALTQFVITFVMMFAVQGVVVFYHWWDAAGPVSLRGLGWTVLFTALYTAAWAPYLHWPLIRLEGWTGLSTRPGFLK
jgi:rod shape-determining protein MreD